MTENEIELKKYEFVNQMVMERNELEYVYR